MALGLAPRRPSHRRLRKPERQEIRPRHPGAWRGPRAVLAVALIGLTWTEDAAAQAIPTAGAPLPATAPAPDVTLALPAAVAASPLVNGIRFIPRASVDFSYTDNVGLTKTQQKGDYITSPSAGFNLSGKTGHSNITFDADSSYDFYGATTRFNGYRVNGVLNAETDLFEKFVSLQANAATNEQIINPLGGSPAEKRSFGQNQAQVLTYGGGPTFRWQFGDLFKAEAAYAVTLVDYYRADSSITAIPANNTTDQNVTLNLTSGSDFSRLTWTIDGSVRRQDRVGTDSASDHRQGEGSLLFAVIPNVQLVATGGYDDIIEPTLNQKLGGVHVTGGLRWALSSRTKITFDAGRRYNKPYYTGELNYSPNSALVLHASYTETIETPQSLAGQNLAGVVTGPVGTLVNPITGLPADPTSNPFGLSNQAFRRNALEFGINGKLAHTTYSLSGSYERRETATGSSKDLGAVATIGRQLSRHLTSIISLTFDRVTGITGIVGVPNGSRSQTVNGRAELDYTLGRQSKLALSYIYQRKLTFPAQVRENVALLTLNRTF